MRMRDMTAIALGAVAMLSLAPMAEAKAASTIAATVAYGDLDITQIDGAREMASRLDHAARRTCGGDPRFDADYGTAPVWVTRNFEACRTQALSDALATLNAPLVSNAVAEREGQNPAQFADAGFAPGGR